MNRKVFLFLGVYLAIQGVSPLWGSAEPWVYGNRPSKTQCEDPTNLVHSLGLTSVQWQKHLEQQGKNAVGGEKGLRSLMDYLPHKGTIPKQVWQNVLSPCLDTAKDVFPVRLVEVEHGGEWIRSNGVVGVKKVSDGWEFVDIKTGKVRHKVPGLSRPRISPDFRWVAFIQEGVMKVASVATGKVIYKIPRQEDNEDLSIFAFDDTSSFLIIKSMDLAGDPQGLSIVDLYSRRLDHVWEIQGPIRDYRIEDGRTLSFVSNNKTFVYDVKTRACIMEVEGCGRIQDKYLLLHNDGRLRVYDYQNCYGSQKIRQEPTKAQPIFDQPCNADGFAYCRIINWGRHIVIGKSCVRNLASGEVVLQLEGGHSVDYGQFIVLGNQDHKFTKIYDLEREKWLYSGQNGEVIECNFPYCVVRNEEGLVVVDLLQGGTPWVIKGGYHKVKISDHLAGYRRLCALTRIREYPPLSSFDWRKSYAVEVKIVDLATKQEIALFESERIPLTCVLNFAHVVFSKKNNVLTVHSYDMDKKFSFDLSALHNKNIRDICLNRFTPSQSAFISLLKEVKDSKKEGESISLYRDIAKTKRLSLKELQDSLATFPDIIQKSLIEKYRIADPTPQETQACIARNNREKKEHAQSQLWWRNAAKGLGVAALVAVAGAGIYWYTRKK